MLPGVFERPDLVWWSALVGFHLQKIDVLGQPGASYSLLEDDRVQATFKTDIPYFEHSSDKALREGAEHKGLFVNEVDMVFLDGDGDFHEVVKQS